MACVWVSPLTTSESLWLFIHYMGSIKLEVGGKKKDPAFQCYRRTHPQLGVCFSTLLYTDLYGGGHQKMLCVAGKWVGGQRRIFCQNSYLQICVCVFAFSCRYASLYFCCAIEEQDNELITLEVIHRFVELLDKYFGSVSNWFFLFKTFLSVKSVSRLYCKVKFELQSFFYIYF